MNYCKYIHAKKRLYFRKVSENLVGTFKMSCYQYKVLPYVISNVYLLSLK